MSRIVYERLREICPMEKVSPRADRERVFRDCKVAFEIIGFHPTDFSEKFDERWSKLTEEPVDLFEFVFDVWGLCNGR